jgi:hypothetical protein
MFQIGERENYENGKWLLNALSQGKKINAEYTTVFTRFLDLFIDMNITTNYNCKSENFYNYEFIHSVSGIWTLIR